VAAELRNDAPYRLIDDVEYGEGVFVNSFTNLYGGKIGDETRIGPFVETQRDASIGARCKIQSHTFVCEGVSIEDEVFVGHGVLFINDKRRLRRPPASCRATRTGSFSSRRWGGARPSARARSSSRA
jgi:carbonic anhydrase/acetyltransferase-like protein (isoleucine patch superfamily)